MENGWGWQNSEKLDTGWCTLNVDGTLKSVLNVSSLGHMPRHLTYFSAPLLYNLDLDSSFGKANCYGLDGSGIESKWGWDFLHPPSLLYTGYWAFPGGKAAGSWRWPPTPYRADVKERVELYLYSPSRPSRPLIGWTLPCTFTLLSNIRSADHSDTVCGSQLSTS
jgi:hypothetical protein